MKKPSRLQRLLSLNQHRKRWGAKRNGSSSKSFAEMKTTIIPNEIAVQTRGSDKSLELHLTNLRREFAGQSDLLWYHAKLIVLLRREFQTSAQYSEFRKLWDQESAFLKENLNIRWLISACDTFAEHDTDPSVRSVAMMTSLLANTVKMHESERFITQSQNLPVDPLQVATLQEKLVPLFEGMSCFTVGTDDTLRNMLWRLQPFMKVAPTGLILEEVWKRLQIEDSVFSRMRNLHHRKKTRWWGN
ncbi:MAG: hypothetical protein P8Q50_10720 [Octadecabacter sp.]|nr:hypothetical protein [Octadecabacter sp.]